MINTGEKRMVLHHLARTQLGEDVVVDGVNKREFYVAQQKKAADFANKFTQVRLLTKTARNSQLLYRSVSVEVI